MRMMHLIIDAPPALRAFLDARAEGRPREELIKLAAEAMREQGMRNRATAKMPEDGPRLVVDNGDVPPAA